MTLVWIKGDIFEVDAKYLVNPVNCYGVSGSGLALEFKKRYPENYAYYQQYSNKLRAGGFNVSEKQPDRKRIINFATKDHWENPTKIEWLENGLPKLDNYLSFEKDYITVAIPALGCGLGGLKFWDVKPIFESVFEDSTVHYIGVLPR